MDYRHRSILRRCIALISFALLAACTGDGKLETRIAAPGDRYVAMGSSFAAGPGILPSADTPATRCGRSEGNYAHLLARELGLELTDVSCSGATTAHILKRSNIMSAQLNAVTSATRLVTITIGGNDVGYIGSLGSASCRSFASLPSEAPGGKCPKAPQIFETEWTRLDGALRRIVSEIRGRAPAARLIFVDYVSVPPDGGTCAAVPLTAVQADAGPATAQRLAMLTTRVAAETGAEVVSTSRLSRNHSACSAEPWVNGFPLPGAPFFVPFHPNARGMAAIAEVLGHKLRGS